jgi:MoxR-like ATPase
MEEVLAAQQAVRDVRIDPRVVKYVLKIVERTRNRDELAAGVSPRGVLSLVRLAQAHAAVDGRDYVLPDDVKTLGPAALAHRVIYRGGFRTTIDEEYGLIRNVLDEVEVP